MKEFAITLNTDHKIPLYEQIYHAFKSAILEGRISPNEKLPSTRFEATYLSCSRSTVELAYEQLLSEGYIKSEPYRGFFVCDVKDLYQLDDMHSDREVMVEESMDEKETFDVDFSPNGIELTQFPFVPMSRIMKNLLLYQGEDILQRSGAFGDWNLREAICDYLYKSRNVKCSPEQIVIGAGNEYLLILLSQLTENRHIIAMESPSYLNAYRTFTNLGYQIETIAMDDSGLRVDLLKETDANIVYVMPSHQFPMGTVMPMKRRLELLNWAVQQENRYIIEDDYDSEFRYKGMPIPALQGMDRFEKVIYMGTFSRSIAPTTRVSYLVLPAHLVERYRQRCGFYSCTVPNVMQQSIYQFIHEGFFEKNLNRMRGIYKGKHDLLLGELKNRRWVKQISGEHSGLHFLVEIDTELSEGEIVEQCKKQGVRVYGLSQYFFGDSAISDKPFFLFGYGGLSEEQIKKGLSVLDHIV